MADYSKDIERLKNPENIKEAVYASSPYVLMKVFENDPIVRRLTNFWVCKKSDSAAGKSCLR